MSHDFESITRGFHTSNYKLTPQRKTILEVFAENSNRHLSAEDIHSILRERASEIGLATIYRTLELLVEMNIIHRVDFGDGRNRYEITPHQGHRHHHLICLNCGEVLEVKEDLLNQLEEIIEQDNGFKIMDHSLKFYGYCRHCLEQKEKGEKQAINRK